MIDYLRGVYLAIAVSNLCMFNVGVDVLSRLNPAWSPRQQAGLPDCPARARIIWDYSPTQFSLYILNPSSLRGFF